MYRYYREEHATDTARVGHFCNGDAARVGVKVALTCGEAVRIGVKVAHMWRSCANWRKSSPHVEKLLKVAPICGEAARIGVKVAPTCGEVA